MSEYLAVAFNASRAAFDNLLVLLDQRILDYRFEEALARLTAADDQYLAALRELLSTPSSWDDPAVSQETK